MIDCSIAPAPAERLIRPEMAWRVPPERLVLMNGGQVSVMLSRWSNSAAEGVEEHVSDVKYDSYVLTVRRRRLSAELFIGDRCLWRGKSPAGELFMTGPKRGRWRAIIHGKYDHLRVYLPQELLRECHEHIVGRSSAASMELFETATVDDEGLRHLAYAFQAAETHSHAAGLSFIDALGVAFAGRLVAVLHGKGTHERDQRAKATHSRLSALIEYIEEHLGKELYLAHLSEVSGLTRYQLVEQFRAATGLPPYAYILRRRIVRAQEFLERPGASIVRVALDLGFSSQGHFTEAFKKSVGVSPGEWRKSQTTG